MRWTKTFHRFAGCEWFFNLGIALLPLIISSGNISLTNLNGNNWRLYLSHVLTSSTQCIQWRQLVNGAFARKNFAGKWIQICDLRTSALPHCCCGFLTGLGPFWLHGQAPNCSQYFGGPFMGCYSYCFSCWQANPDLIHQARLGAHCLTNQPSLLGLLQLFSQLLLPLLTGNKARKRNCGRPDSQNNESTPHRQRRRSS